MEGSALLKIKKEKLLRILAYTVLFWIIAHGYRYFNNLYAGDAFIEVFQDDIYYQRSLGRFMQPVILIFRGVICAPWLLGVTSVLIFSVSFYIVAELLRIDSKSLLFFMCGILVCNNTVTSASAAFLPWVDVFALALFLAVLGVYFLFKDKWWGYLAGIVLLICSMGFYQAYIDVALGLIIILLIVKMADNENVIVLIKRAAKLIVSLIVSAVGYWCLYKVILVIHKVEEADSYNGLGGVGDFGGISFFKLLGDTYAKFFAFLGEGGGFASMILRGIRVDDIWHGVSIFCIIVCGLLTVTLLVLLNIKNRTSVVNRVLQFLAVLLFPLIANIVNVISKGMEHALMAYSVFLYYVLLIYLLNRYAGCCEIKPVRMGICMVPVFALIWINVVFSNQIYFKVDMQDRAALSYATRVVAQIEEMDGYEPGVTPVVFVGNPEYSDNNGAVDYLKQIDVYGLADSKTAFFRGRSFQTYLKYYLNADIVILEEAIPTEFTADMGEYPEKGYARFIGDILVVKLSEY